MAKVVSFLVETRRFDFFLDVLSVKNVKEKFMEFAENDPNLSGRIERTPLFYAYSPKCHKDVELSESSVLHDGQTIRVKLQDSDENDTLNTDTETVTIRIVTDVELREMGVTRENWEKLPTILKERELNRLEQHKLMFSMGFVNTPYQGTLSEAEINKRAPRRNTKGKTTSPPKDNIKRVKPLRRTSKRLNDKENINPTIPDKGEPQCSAEVENQLATIPDAGEPQCSAEVENQLEDETIQDTTVSNDAAKPSLATSVCKQKKMVKRNSLSKITKYNALPNFSSGLKNILRKKYLSKSEKMSLISEVEHHLIMLTGDSYLKPKEWEILSNSIVEKYPTLEDIDMPGQSNELKHSLQTSIVARRYRKNKKERKSEADEAATDEPSSSTNETDTSLIDELKAKNPFESASYCRLSFLIKSTLAERETANANQTVEDILKDYPHYKNTKLVIYEHTLMVGMTIDFLTQNALNLISRLKDHFDITSDIIDQEVEAITMLQDALLPKNFVQNAKIVPAISAWDEKEKQKDISLLGTTADSHAPWATLIIGTNKDGDRILKTCFIQILHKNFRSEMTLPTLPDVLIGLLSFYFVFNIQYPTAYISFLRFLEKYVHGKLSEFSQKQRGKAEYRDFIAKFEK